jgi:hypothetical protein
VLNLFGTCGWCSFSIYQIFCGSSTFIIEKHGNRNVRAYLRFQAEMKSYELGMVVNSCDPSTQEAEEGDETEASLGCCCGFQASLGYETLA